MAGARDPLPQSTHALLGEDLPANNARTDYLRAELRDGRAYASTIQDSSMLLTLARSTCLIVRARQRARRKDRRIGGNPRDRVKRALDGVNYVP